MVVVIDVSISALGEEKSKLPLRLAFIPILGTTADCTVETGFAIGLEFVNDDDCCDDDGVVERRVEINCLARFRFSVLEMDGAAVVVLDLSLFVIAFDGAVLVCSIEVVTTDFNGVVEILDNGGGTS